MIRQALLIVVYLPIFAGMDLMLGRLTGSDWGLVGFADTFFGAMFGLAVATHPLFIFGLVGVWSVAALLICLWNLYRGYVH
ncbi:hypothetical protein HZC00_01440 [Candidatus Kaiserbacteria bacterium]|nr:hypothetical protein [Candidatus Kaiserbacteria bacterium]